MDRRLLDKIMRLKPADRMHLLNSIYTSLERLDQTIDEIWHDEAAKRLDAYKAGNVQGIPADKVLGDRP